MCGGVCGDLCGGVCGGVCGVEYVLVCFVLCGNPFEVMCAFELKLK